MNNTNNQHNRNLRAVVTGGAGFIGSHIADGLADRGWQITIIDNLSTGRRENIQHLVGAGRAELIEGSITDLSLLQKVFEGVDYVFHEAAISSVPRSIDNPAASNEANITGTLNVLLAARDNRVKKVVFASSASVYGDAPALPKQEDMKPDPLSPYALTKLTAEYYCRIFNDIFKLPTASLRYFNVYGPRQAPDSQYAAVIPKFIQSIIEGKSPVIFGDGEQSRDFVFVKDVVAVNILAAETGATGIFNIGQGEKITLNELTRIMLKFLDRKDIRPTYEKERTGDIKHSLADITRVRSFGYSPQYDIETGIRETIRSFRDNPA
ncbi:MAG: SDR family oxidoreductase [Dehalococcoidales bacterium]|nr:SDR family oxidoreductase [Dehalococcoidales bacterium]